MRVTSIEASKASRRIGAWTVQGVVAAAFFAAGLAKLAGARSMVELFDQIAFGQWFRIVTGVVEIIGAVALVFPGMAPLGGLWAGGIMVGAVATHVFILHTSPVPAIILGSLSALIVYLRRDELPAFVAFVRG